MAESVANHLKSLNADAPAFVQFINSTDRMVNLFWLNYTGKLVRYGHIPPHKGMSMDTYVTHPWVARDAATSYPLLLNGNQIFYPQSERGGQIFHDRNRERVDIRIPVFPLFRRCLEVVYLYFQREAIAWTNIPKNIKDVLFKMSPPTEFNDYKHFDSVIYEHLQDIEDADQDDENSDIVDAEQGDEESDIDEIQDHIEDNNNEINIVDNGNGIEDANG